MAEYPNRSDLRNPAQKIAKQAAPGQTYGEAGKQMRAQEAVPMGGSPTEAAPSRPARPRPTPGGMGALDRPTERPGDSLVGAGSGMAPETLMPLRDPVVDELEVLFRMYPNDDLADLISALKFGGR